MTERLERMMAAFHAARAETDPTARDRILVEACTREDGSIDEEMLVELRAMVTTEVPAGFLEPEPPPEPPPRLGEFALKHVLATGGCGVVWVARQASLDRDVAVKVLTAGPGTSAAQIERFHREPLAASSLNHPHIVPVFAEGRTGDTHWFAMQLVDGHSLAREIELQRARNVADPPPLLPRFATGQWFAAVARICADAADALHLAHQHRIVHRDVKPHNLLLDRQGNVVVADFGIARDERYGALTETGAIAGSWPYMSPEQARIEKDPVDHRTDIYSLGVVLYELLTLARPYEGTTSQEVIDQIRRAPARPVCRRNRQVPRDLETICMAAIARCPADRYATAADLRDDLLRFLEHQAITRQPPSLPVRVQQWLHRRRRPLTLAATVVVVSIVSLLVQSSVYVAAEHSNLIQRCDALLRSGNLDALPVGDLAALWRDVRGAGDSAAPSARAADATLMTYRDGLLTRWHDGLEAAARAPEPTARYGAIMSAFQLGWRAHSLDPARAMPAEFDENPFHCAVGITVTDDLNRPVPATVGMQYLDPTTGLAEDEVLLGPAPIARWRARDGMYRLVVHSAQYGERTFSRLFAVAERTTVVLDVHAVDDPMGGMVRIPAGTLQIGPTDGPAHGLRGRAVAIPEFWIDRCEVTVADYRRFLRDTNHRPTPPSFDRIPASHDRRPVVNVTWADARAYAEWAGKRLPSLPEWMLAARGAGPNPRLLPWAGPGIFGNCQAAVDFDNGSADSRFEAYLRHATDVDASLDSRTPEGVFELLGNVEEWTESLGVTRGEAGLIAQHDHRMVAGLPWFGLTFQPKDNLTTTTNADEGPMYWRFCRGFRCARSTTQ